MKGRYDNTDNDIDLHLQLIRTGVWSWEGLNNVVIRSPPASGNRERDDNMSDLAIPGRRGYSCGRVAYLKFHYLFFPS